jgi:hypothetical protein
MYCIIFDKKVLIDLSFKFEGIKSREVNVTHEMALREDRCRAYEGRGKSVCLLGPCR